jgi:hypothetical protein
VSRRTALSDAELDQAALPLNTFAENSRLLSLPITRFERSGDAGRERAAAISCADSQSIKILAIVLRADKSPLSLVPMMTASDNPILLTLPMSGSYQGGDDQDHPPKYAVLQSAFYRPGDARSDFLNLRRNKAAVFELSDPDLEAKVEGFPGDVIRPQKSKIHPEASLTENVKEMQKHIKERQ